ncbi:hypothetical protein DPMN_180408 [Dreissena polymorpha]|uniref:Uncharacterized protein n=1 Tax=Dreissena polymorpha TaxID=45954 RepID=A0A9D4EI23_DREPO|nr:hypothetical protein DPMN_180408 [Dreissena polymorpha]
MKRSSWERWHIPVLKLQTLADAASAAEALKLKWMNERLEPKLKLPELLKLQSMKNYCRKKEQDAKARAEKAATDEKMRIGLPTSRGLIAVMHRTGPMETVCIDMGPRTPCRTRRAEPAYAAGEHRALGPPRESDQTEESRLSRSGSQWSRPHTNPASRKKPKARLAVRTKLKLVGP